ncbi:hypothetical protein BC827DRAFT_1234217 [Russula dissimulans]|nr:hypothetical protein BC827DRAFT_1234217 [Russula dissimulans]
MAKRHWRLFAHCVQFRSLTAYKPQGCTSGRQREHVQTRVSLCSFGEHIRALAPASWNMRDFARLNRCRMPR